MDRRNSVAKAAAAAAANHVQFRQLVEAVKIAFNIVETLSRESPQTRTQRFREMLGPSRGDIWSGPVKPGWGKLSVTPTTITLSFAMLEQLPQSWVYAIRYHNNEWELRVAHDTGAHRSYNVSHAGELKRALDTAARELRIVVATRETRAATRIQAAWRGKKARNEAAHRRFKPGGPGFRRAKADFVSKLTS